MYIVPAFNERIKAVMYHYAYYIGLNYTDILLEKGLYVASFDFSGCGNSDGNCISFGSNEKYDVQAVI